MIVGLVLAVIFATISQGGAEPEAASAPTVGQGVQRPPAPIAVEATVDGDQAQFSWVNPQPEHGDTYRVRVETDAGVAAPEVVSEPEISVDLRQEGETCITVTVVRESKAESSATEGCISE